MEKFDFFRFVWIFLSIFPSGESQVKSRGIVFEPNLLTIQIGKNGLTAFRIIADSNQTVSVDFFYGKNRSNTTDYIKTLDSISFNRQTSQIFNVQAKRAGHLIVSYESQPTLDAKLTGNEFLHVDIPKSFFLNQLIDLLGWSYFFAWSISFYPQIILNYQRKSVVGLNFDFLALNLLGFFCYSVFNVALFWSTRIQDSYRIHHPYGIIPVMFSDVVFSVHAFVITLVTIIQCSIYERSNQRVSYSARFFLLFAIVFLTSSTALAGFQQITWLSLIYIFSYVKLTITIIKYVPQAVMNYRRQSTVGWSIGNILLDLSGGILSFVQMIFLAVNYDDWGSIFGSVTKIGLSLVSIGFDIIFILQHYVFYRNKHEPVENALEKSENKS